MSNGVEKWEKEYVQKRISLADKCRYYTIPQKRKSTLNVESTTMFSPPDEHVLIGIGCSIHKRNAERKVE